MTKPFAPLVAGFCAMSLALLTSACVSVTAAPAGPYKVGAAQVTLGSPWSDVSQIMTGRPRNVRLLSLDGPLLNRLYVSDGLAPGEFLVKPASPERPTPVYRTGLSPTEMVEFVTDSVAALDYQRVETTRTSPRRFAAGEAVGVELTAKTKEGLDMSGRAMVAEHGGKLFVVLYLAPTEYYFAAHLPEVEAILNSATVAG